MLTYISRSSLHDLLKQYWGDLRAAGGKKRPVEGPKAELKLAKLLLVSDRLLIQNSEDLFKGGSFSVWLLLKYLKEVTFI